jgi:Dolichyl-phosphate-mannose-protein mannosyltransferase
MTGLVVRTGLIGSARSRWRASDRDTKIALVGIVSLLGGAIGVRAWLMTSYSPAFLGFPDSSDYLIAAAKGIFGTAQYPAGYPLFLRLVHHLSSYLPFTIGVQHAMGVASGLLLYASVRRTAAPAWLGLVPAAIVFFGGTGLILEHALLSDPLLSFLQALGIYFVIRALHDSRARWSLLAGVVIGLSFWIRTVAISSAVLIPIVLLCGTPGGLRRRLLSASLMSLAVMALIVTYVVAQDHFTGYLGYERQDAWNLYARVATFVNCDGFTPPPGTRFLCPSEPLGHRMSQGWFQYDSSSPAVRRFGFPNEASSSANRSLLKFSVAVIEHEPIAYAEAIARGLSFYVFPRAGEGYVPASVREEVVSTPTRARAGRSFYAMFYSDAQSYTGPASSLSVLSTYERYTRVQGALMVILLLFAIGGLFFLRGRTRWAAATFTLTAIFSITFAIAGNSYDARYAYPTFGPLGAGAALGAWGAWLFLTRKVRELREREPVASAKA